MQDPERYLAAIGVGVKCMMEPEREAILDAAHRTSVGFETYFFSTDEAKQTFDGDIPAYCGILTDPVTKTRFRPIRNSPRTRYGDRLYLFAADSCKMAFDQMPEMYALPDHSMIPRAAGPPPS